MFNLGRISRSPPRYQPRDPLQNDERPLPIGWNRAFSHNVDPGRVYYTNGGHSQWNFPNPEGELQDRFEDVQRRVQRRQARQARRQARIENAQAEADRLALIEAAQAEADRLARIQLAQAGNDLLENLTIISINNNFNERNIGVLNVLTRIITEDNEEPINRSTIRTYIMNLEVMIRMLRDRNVHYNLKYLCEKIFQEIYEKLAKEKQMIDNEFTSHNERDTIYINAELNRLNSIYISFSNIINNVSDPPGPDYLSVETRTALALLPDVYIDPRLESWENMSARYEDFDVDLYHTFGRSVGGSMFTTPTGNRARYENFLSGEAEDIRFVVLAAGDLRLGQRLLPLTQEQEVQLQNVLDVLERCRREINGATFF